MLMPTLPDRLRRQQRRWTVLLIAVITIPLWWPDIPPLTDLPGHMAMYYLAQHLPDNDFLSKFYTWKWSFIGNLGANLLVIPLSATLGVEAATKLVVILTVTGTALGLIALSRISKGGIIAAAFALPLIYNYAFIFGFINYSIGMAVALNGLALWIKMYEANVAKRAAVFAALALVIWICHAVAWAMFLVMCAGAELYRLGACGRRDRGAELVRSLGSGIALLTPLIPMSLAAGSSPSQIDGFFALTILAKGFATVLRDRWMILDLSSAALLYLFVGAAVLRLAGLRWSGPVACAALGLLVLYCLSPQTINGSAYLSVRIIPFALALAVVAVDTHDVDARKAGALALMAFSFMLFRTATNTASNVMYDRSYKNHLSAVKYIEPRSRVAAFVADNDTCSERPSWSSARLGHLSGLVVARREAFVNSTWSLAGLHPLSVHYPEAGKYQSDPSGSVVLTQCGSDAPLVEEAIAQLPKNSFDYVWLLDIPRERQPNVKWLEPVWQINDGALYRVLPRAGGEADDG